MKNYDFVELVAEIKDLEEKGICKGSKGTIIELKNNNALIVFFNDKKTWEIMQLLMLKLSF